MTRDEPVPRLARRSVLLAVGAAVTATACNNDSADPAIVSDVPEADRRPVGELPADGRVPAPIGMIRTNWSLDPHTLGSYSFMKAGATPEDRAALRRPVGDRVFFAGEHVNVDYPSTVHGAMASGRRAADEVLAVAANGERIVVVGAGIAGLTCARALREASMEITIVEARQRVGGRLDTVRPSGWSIPLELGASWVHDTDASDLDRRLVGAGIAARPWNWDDIASWDLRDGGAATAAVTERIVGIVDAATGAAEADKDDVSTLAAAVAAQDAVVSVNPTELEYFDEVELATEYGAGADELSARWALEEGSEGTDLLVTGGYVGLADRLVDGFEPRLGEIVDLVTWDRSEVVVRSNDSERRADRVVVTVPLGVLQAGSIRFDPPLPREHRDAIERLGMGLLDKFWFRFDRLWWRQSAVVWSLRGAVDTPFVQWYNLEPATGQPILLSLLGAARAREWSTRSDDEVTGAARIALQHFADAGW